VSAAVFVVLGSLEATELELPGRERVALASERAREALYASARLSGADLGLLEKDARDAPLPSNGWHWSIAHAGPCVVGVVCRQPVGVDLEPLADRRPELVAAALGPAERDLLAPFGEEGFVRGWTAKEAVLKKLGVGLTELSRCRIVEIDPAGEVLELEHDGRGHRVHATQLGLLIAAVSFDGPDRPVRWELTGEVA
jgi:4'-phosphopantetheinyl transferase